MIKYCNAVMAADKLTTNLTPCDYDRFKYLTNLQTTKDNADKAAAAAAAGDDKVVKEAKAALPVIAWSVQATVDGTGRRDKYTNMISNPFFMGDFDHVPHASAVAEQIAQSLKPNQRAIVYVGVTPTQTGIRLVGVRKPNETIADAQHRIAAEYDLIDYLDNVATDVTRLSFIVPPENIKYINRELFSVPAEKLQAADAAFTLLDRTGKVSNSTQSVKTTQNQNNTEVAYKPEPKEPLITHYRGALLTDIVDKYIELLDKHQIVKGERNTSMYKIFINLLQIVNSRSAAEAVKHIVKSIDDSDVVGPFKSAAEKIYSGDNIYIDRDFRLAIDMLATEPDENESEEEDTQQTPDYPLPEILQIMTANLPSPFIMPAIVLYNSALGAMLTNCTFRYWFDHHQQHFSFLSLLIAEQGAGKSSIIFGRLQTLIQPLINENNRAEEAWQIYDDAMEHRKNGDEMPAKPTQAYRIAPTDITSAAFLNALSRANGKTMLLFDDEAKAFFAAGGGEQYRITKEIVKKAYDQGNYKYGRLDKHSSVNITLNLALAGTAAVRDHFKDAGEGDVARYSLATIENVPLHMDPIDPLSGEDVINIERITRDLSQKSGEIHCPWIDAEAHKFRDELEDEMIENADDALALIYKRVVVNFTRIAYMYACLYGIENDDNEENEQKRRAALAWAKYIALYQKEQTLRFFGKLLAKSSSELPPKIKKIEIFKSLPDVFANKDVVEVCKNKSESASNPNKIIKNWILNGLAQKLDFGKYEKIKK